MTSGAALFIIAGVLLNFFIFLTPPWTILNIILGITPLAFALYIFILMRRAKKENDNDKEILGTDSE